MRKPMRRGPTRLALMLLGVAWACTVSAQSEAPIAPSAAEPPPAASQTARLRDGETVTLRIRQVIPCDGLTPGERLLSGRPAIAPGDRVLAEDVRPGVHPPRSSAGRSFTSIRPGGLPNRAGSLWSWDSSCGQAPAAPSWSHGSSTSRTGGLIPRCGGG